MVSTVSDIIPVETCYNPPNPSTTSIKMQATDDISLTSEAMVGLAEDIVPVSTFF